MPKAKVGILRTSPATVFRDYHSVMNLAGYQEILDKTADTAEAMLRIRPILMRTRRVLLPVRHVRIIHLGRDNL